MVLLLTFVAIMAIGLIIADHYRSRAKHPRKRLVTVAAVVAIGITLGATFMLKSLNSSAPNGWTWEMVSWRARLFVLKAEGDVPDLSWRELWFMTHIHGGFGLEGFVNQGIGLEGAVANPYLTSSDDQQRGARIFRKRCAVCHGNDGAGGQAPRLNRSGLRHGDGDLAMYKVVRDGIPQTGMAAFAMSPEERWQVVSYLRTLQLAASIQNTEQLPPVDIQVSNEQIRTGSRPDQWLTYSGSLDGRRYTPLTEVNSGNVSRLRVRWIRQFGTSEPKSESTPIVVGGVIFMTEPPCNVIALDVRSGQLRWQYRPSLPNKLPLEAGMVNRGLAVLGNVLFLSGLDGFLVAINATNGNVIWKTAVVNPPDGYTMTGAPLIVNGLVVVGIAGAEFGIRGFLAAYDAETGRQQWRFNTIPGPGELGHETWKNDAWRTGGGATWMTGSYDPSLDLLYWGVGNPAPSYQGDVRPGDNLFSDSVIALHASSGKLAWYFQFTPHDEHDWDSVQTPILADILIKGVLRRVICVANRNGFYYVLDRTTGEFLLGVPFVEQNWAKCLDSAGRPVLSSEAEVSLSGRLTRPGVGGGTNWQNAAFDLKSESIFVPATEGASVFTKSPNPKRGDLGFYPGSTGLDAGGDNRVVRALDVATGAKKWEYFLPRRNESFTYVYSGLLATGGGLVFGASGGFAFAIDSATGREVWRVFLGGDTYAPPISFTVDGHQVILVSVGRALFMFGL